MDIRALLAGIAFLAGITAAVILYLQGEPDGAKDMGALAGMALTYIVGLHSEAFSGDQDA